MKTGELTGAALDWAVGTALKLPPPLWAFGKCAQFSTDWAQGGPIIEQESIQICQLEDGNWRGQLHVKSFGPYCRQYGFSPLIAAMRCYVASKLGEEIELPEELK